MGVIEVPPTWDVALGFVTNRGRRVNANVQSFGKDFTDAIDNMSDDDLKAAGLDDEATPKLDDDEVLVEVTLSARRRG